MPKEWWELVPLAADPSKLPSLATEIWERILDELDALDWEHRSDFGPRARARSFFACCSVCRVWVPRSRYHLFKDLVIQSKRQVKEVSKLLHSNPTLRTRVESLTVIGSGDGRTDASWIGRVGFHLGPKLKSLRVIWVERVNFSLTKLEDYKFWGTFNRAWSPSAKVTLTFAKCNVTHVGQLLRLAFVTKAEGLGIVRLDPIDQAESAPPSPALSSGIVLPLQRFNLGSRSLDLVFHTPWRTLAIQSPSLSSVHINCANIPTPSSPGSRLFLVSILRMFYSMQQRNDTSHVVLRTASMPTIVMGTMPYEQLVGADNIPPEARPRLHRGLVLFHRYPSARAPMDVFAEPLACLEDAMLQTNYINRRFYYIEMDDPSMFTNLRPDSFQSIDGVLSRLCIATHDVHVVIKGRNQPYEGCIVPWAREYFPMLTEVVPNAFCDPETEQPCESHPEQVCDDAQEAGDEVKDEGLGD